MTGILPDPGGAPDAGGQPDVFRHQSPEPVHLPLRMAATTARPSGSSPASVSVIAVRRPGRAGARPGPVDAVDRREDHTADLVVAAEHPVRDGQDLAAGVSPARGEQL